MTSKQRTLTPKQIELALCETARAEAEHEGEPVPPPLTFAGRAKLTFIGRDGQPLAEVPFDRVLVNWE